MNSDWTMIGRGMLVASAGAVASMLMIVGVSAGYVGKFTISIMSLALATCLALAFRVSLTPFLDALDRREAEFIADVDDKHQQTDNR